MHNWVSLTFGQLFSLTGLVSHIYSAWKTVPISSLDYRAYINIRWWQIHWAIFLWAGSSGKYTMQTYIPKQLVKEYKGTEWNRIQQIERVKTTLMDKDNTMIRLTHWGRDKMASMFQTTFSSTFSWMRMYEFWLRFHWSLFPMVQLTIFQHWFR